MVHFVGAGPGAVDLITVRGQELLRNADMVIYAGSLVNPELLGLCKEDARLFDSARMTLEEVLSEISLAEEQGLTTVRLHSGDPGLYGAIREQIDALREKGIAFDVTPGVSSFNASAAALETEYTPAGVSQSVIITRMEGRTAVPERERLRELSAHGATMAIFLSIGLAEEVERELLAGGTYTKDTPVAILYKVSWPEERIFRCRLSELSETVRKNGITKTALIIVGEFLSEAYEKSRLYAADFSTEYRQGTQEAADVKQNR
ncbi:MAG: precorrin-4 C(11)-methyltransferase [Lachnospiraceae bacterium]|nr:precorrin-4 C(11)-methyltransferase [Lachnospiraceae bacterium]